MNNFGPSVKAVRKASTHLTEEPINRSFKSPNFVLIIVAATLYI